MRFEGAYGDFSGSIIGVVNESITASYIDPTFISASAAAAGFGQGGGGSTSWSSITGKPTVLSGSAQIKTQISGAFTSTSSSLASRVTSLKAASASLSTRVTTIENSGAPATTSTSASYLRVSLDPTPSNEFRNVAYFAEQGDYPSAEVDGVLKYNAGTGVFYAPTISGSVEFAVSASYISGSVPNLYTQDGVLTNTRVVDLNGNTLTFDAQVSDFEILSDPSFAVTISGLPNQKHSRLIFQNPANGQLTYSTTASFTASYARRTISASYARTASYIQGLGSIASGGVTQLTASQAQTASYALTASYVEGGGANIYTQNGTLTGNRTVNLIANDLTFQIQGGAIKLSQLDGPIPGTGDASGVVAYNPNTGKLTYHLTSSLRTTSASFARRALTASYALNAQGTNIYTSDGTIEANRQVTIGNNPFGSSLTFAADGGDVVLSQSGLGKIKVSGLEDVSNEKYLIQQNLLGTLTRVSQSVFTASYAETSFGQTPVPSAGFGGQRVRYRSIYGYAAPETGNQIARVYHEELYAQSFNGNSMFIQATLAPATPDTQVYGGSVYVQHFDPTSTNPFSSQPAGAITFAADSNVSGSLWPAGMVASYCVTYLENY